MVVRPVELSSTLEQCQSVIHTSPSPNIPAGKMRLLILLILI